MKLFVNEGPNFTEAALFSPGEAGLAEEAFGLFLRSGAEASELRVLTDVRSLLLTQADSTRHEVRIRMQINPTTTEVHRHGGFILWEVLGVDSNASAARTTLYQAARAVHNYRSVDAPVSDPGNPDYVPAAGLSPILANTIPDFSAFLAASNDPNQLVEVVFKDIRAWWSLTQTYAEPVNTSAGRIPRVPAGLRNLYQETPRQDLTTDAPEAYPGQHSESAFNALSTPAREEIENNREIAERSGGLLQPTRAVNERPLVDSPPAPSRGGRMLTWGETLDHLLAEVGAYDATPSPATSPIDRSGFVPPVGVAPPIGESQEGAFDTLVRFLHETGHVLAPHTTATETTADGQLFNRFRIVPMLLSNSVDTVWAWKATNGERVEKKVQLFQLPDQPLPPAYAVYAAGDDDNSWSLGAADNDPNVRGTHRGPVHILYSTEALLKDLDTLFPPGSVLPRLASEALSERPISDTTFPQLPSSPTFGARPIDCRILRDLVWGGVQSWTDNATNATAFRNWENQEGTVLRLGYADNQYLASPCRSPSLRSDDTATAPFRLAQVTAVGDLISRSTERITSSIATSPDGFVQEVHHALYEGYTDIEYGAPTAPPRIDPVKRENKVITVQLQEELPKASTRLVRVSILHGAQTETVSSASPTAEQRHTTVLGSPTFDPLNTPPRPDTGPTSSLSHLTQPTRVGSGSVGDPPTTTGFDSDQPYWRVEPAVVIATNFSSRGRRVGEILTLHSNSGGTYTAAPDPGTVLGVVRATEPVSPNQTSYEAELVREYRSNRIHAQEPESSATSSDTNPEVIARVRVLRGGESTEAVVEGSRRIVSLVGMDSPWPQNETSLEYPLGDATQGLSNAEVWQELPLSTETSSVVSTETNQAKERIRNDTGRRLRRGDPIWIDRWEGASPTNVVRYLDHFDLDAEPTPPVDPGSPPPDDTLIHPPQRDGSFAAAEPHPTYTANQLTEREPVGLPIDPGDERLTHVAVDPPLEQEIPGPVGDPLSRGEARRRLLARRRRLRLVVAAETIEAGATGEAIATGLSAGWVYVRRENDTHAGMDIPTAERTLAYNPSRGPSGGVLSLYRTGSGDALGRDPRQATTSFVPSPRVLYSGTSGPARIVYAARRDRSFAPARLPFPEIKILGHRITEGDSFASAIAVNPIAGIAGNVLIVTLFGEREATSSQIVPSVNAERMTQAGWRELHRTIDRQTFHESGGSNPRDYWLERSVWAIRFGRNTSAWFNTYWLANDDTNPGRRHLVWFEARGVDWARLVASPSESPAVTGFNEGELVTRVAVAHAHRNEQADT